MPELQSAENNVVMSGTRRKRDTTLDDAIKTMERFADWLTAAREQNVWRESDPLGAAMLYGMLTHLSENIQALIALGGEEARTTHEFFISHASTPPSDEKK